MAKTRKQVSMTVTVSVPTWLTAAQARREVRSLINNLSHTGAHGPGIFDEVDEFNFRARKVSPAS